MKALVFHGPGDIRLEERPLPRVSDNEVLIKVDAAGICPTDIRIVKFGHSRVKTPRILGHEIAGTIFEVGNNVSGLMIGDKVVVNPLAPCLICDYCKRGFHNLCEHSTILGYNADGGYSEYMVLPSDFVKKGLVYKLSDNISVDVAALIEPVASCLEAIETIDKIIGIGVSSVMIVGDGPNAAILSLLAKLYGASRVVVMGKLEHRLKIIKKIVADEVVNVDEEGFTKAMELTDGRGFEIVISSIGNRDAIINAIHSASKTGVIHIFGGAPPNTIIELDPNLIHYKRLVVTGSSGYRLETFNKAFIIVTRKLITLDEVISHKFNLNRWQEALNYVDEYRGFKVIFKPSSQ